MVTLLLLSARVGISQKIYCGRGGGVVRCSVEKKKKKQTVVRNGRWEETCEVKKYLLIYDF